MPDEIALESPIADPMRVLIERVSDLEEENRNLRRLHLTIERNNNLFEALLASSHDGITLTRLDGTVIRVVRPVLGYAPSEMSGIQIEQLIHPDDRQTLREMYRRIREEREPRIDFELRLLRPDGTSAWVTGTMTDMLDDAAVQAVVCNYRNVSRLRAAELRSAELAAVIGHAPFVIFSKDLRGEILTWNDGAREMFGYEPDEIVGRHVSVLVPPELREEEERCRQMVIERRTSLRKFRTVRVRKDGARIPIELVLCPLATDGCIRGLVHLSMPYTGGAEARPAILDERSVH